MPQRPLVQTGAALAGAQVSPQPPQWATVTRVSVSQPLVATPSQLP